MSDIRLQFADRVVWIGRGDDASPEDVVLDAGPVRLVTEKAAAFRRRNEDATVLFRHGPFVLVPAGEEIRKGSGLDFSVREVDGDAVVASKVDVEPGEPRRQVEELIGETSSASFCAGVEKIAGHSRVSRERGFGDAMDWIAGQLEGAGWTVERQGVRFRHLGQPWSTENALATRPGADGASGITVVCAHLDALGDAEGAAWGADDNASGCAALLEIAKLFGGRELRHELRLLFFGGEEQGLHGSYRYAKDHAKDLRAAGAEVVNLDMIGHVYRDETGVLLNDRDRESRLVRRLARAAATYAPQLEVCASDEKISSDHRWFQKRGVDAAMAVELGVGSVAPETGGGSVIHTSEDTPDRIDCGQGVAITRMVAAYLAERLP